MYIVIQIDRIYVVNTAPGAWMCKTFEIGGITGNSCKCWLCNCWQLIQILLLSVAIVAAFKWCGMGRECQWCQREGAYSYEHVVQLNNVSTKSADLLLTWYVPVSVGGSKVMKPYTCWRFAGKVITDLIFLLLPSYYYNHLSIRPYILRCLWVCRSGYTENREERQCDGHYKCGIQYTGWHSIW